MKIFEKAEIIAAIDLNKELPALLENQKQAFIDFSAGAYSVPLPIQLNFSTHQSDSHIKAGCKKDSQNYVIKVAGASYAQGSKISGMLWVLDKQTGKVIAFLKDDGWLTVLRTAVSAILCAKNLTPWEIKSIGIIGKGELGKKSNF